MRRELKNHLPPIIAIFLSTCLLWVLYSTPFLHFLLLFLGLALGTFFLDIDHLVYWYYLKPNLGESQVAKKLILQKNYKDLFAHLALYHKGHTSLIFHHFIFQAVLLVLTFFVLSSTPTIFGKAFCLAIYIHLLVDQINDYRKDPHHLATWLFARSPLKPKTHHLKNYLIFYSSFLPLFLYLLFRTK